MAHGDGRPADAPPARSGARGRGDRSVLDLHDALRTAQRAGFLGDRPVAEVVAHARHFVEALHDVRGTIVDLGAGGGVPGLVVAFDRPDLRVTLLDRRTKRTDFLSRVVRRLGWTEGVEVVAADAADVAARRTGEFDAVVARGFGPPDRTLEVASRLVRAGGLVIVSEPPPGAGGPRWPEDLLVATGLARRPSTPYVAVFRRLSVSRETSSPRARGSEAGPRQLR